jgi:hypothetical protein
MTRYHSGSGINPRSPSGSENHTDLYQSRGEEEKDGSGWKSWGIGSCGKSRNFYLIIYGEDIQATRRSGKELKKWRNIPGKPFPGMKFERGKQFN